MPAYFQDSGTQPEGVVPGSPHKSPRRAAGMLHHGKSRRLNSPPMSCYLSGYFGTYIDLARVQFGETHQRVSAQEALGTSNGQKYLTANRQPNTFEVYSQLL